MPNRINSSMRIINENLDYFENLDKGLNPTDTRVNKLSRLEFADKVKQLKNKVIQDKELADRIATCLTNIPTRRRFFLVDFFDKLSNRLNHRSFISSHVYTTRLAQQLRTEGARKNINDALAYSELITSVTNPKTLHKTIATSKPDLEFQNHIQQVVEDLKFYWLSKTIKKEGKLGRTETNIAKDFRGLKDDLYKKDKSHWARQAFDQAIDKRSDAKQLREWLAKERPAPPSETQKRAEIQELAERDRKKRQGGPS